MAIREKPKRGRGRPRQEPQAGDRVPVSLRVTPALKNQLAVMSSRTGRSLSQECEFRLESSLQRDAVMIEVLVARFGRRLAGLLLLVGEAMFEAGHLAAWDSTGGESIYESTQRWPDDAFACEMARQAAMRILEILRPSTPPSAPAKFKAHPEEALQFGVQSADFLIGLLIRNPSTTKLASSEENRIVEEILPLLGSLLRRFEAIKSSTDSRKKLEG